MMKRLLFVFVILLFVLIACGQEPDPTPLPTAVVATDPVLEATAVPPTALPTTETNQLAATLPPPAIVSEATATQPPPEATGTATATPVLLLTAEDFGTDRNPLTGELVDDPLTLQRRPFTVKLSNSPPSYTRPQSGLNDADIVYEHTTEGSITRFTAIFYGKSPESVGPIRSARLIDVELPAMYDAALFYSGSSTGVGNRLFSSDFKERIFQESAQSGFYRTGEDKPWEHTLYGRPEQFWQALEARDLNAPPNFGSYMAFSEVPPAAGEVASGVVIDYDWELVEWRYDAAIGRYRRWSDGVEHLDGNTDEQVVAANIIIISPVHAFDGTICEEIRNGVCAHQSVQIQIWGSGTGIVLRDGLVYNVTWHRENRNDMLTFTDSTNNPFPLQIGNSWVQLVPTWLDNPVTVSP
jgi:hypothetical protein